MQGTDIRSRGSNSNTHGGFGCGNTHWFRYRGYAQVVAADNWWLGYHLYNQCTKAKEVNYRECTSEPSDDSDDEAFKHLEYTGRQFFYALRRRQLQ